MKKLSPLQALLVTAAFAGFVLLVAFRVREGGRSDAPKGPHARVAEVDVAVTGGAARLVLTEGSATARLAVVVKEPARDLLPRFAETRAEGESFVAPLVGGGVVRVVPAGAPGVLRVELTGGAPEAALALDVELGKGVPFLAGTGDEVSPPEATTDLVLFGAGRVALAPATDAADADTAALSVVRRKSERRGGGDVLRVVAGPPLSRALFVAVGADEGRLAGRLAAARKRTVAAVTGIVHGDAASRRSTFVYGVDAEGKPRVRATLDDAGRFAVAVPRDVNRWYAKAEGSVASPPLFFEPGAGFDLRLDVAPPGELAIVVKDADAPDRSPIARVMVRGIEGTLDPDFGPDYRASGAGPLVDARGGVTTPVTSGRYRVSATKGIEWSVDAVDVTVEPGKRTAVELELRHVVPTPDQVGCDLHVHARPSFDSPVLVEDRVLSLVSAGVDFAVPTEHNVVGDYAPALAVLSLGGALASVPGVEVTTYTPRFGHFGVFPWDADAGVPPYRKTTPAALSAAVRRDARAFYQVHHPRLPNEIGYFAVGGFRPASPKGSGLRLDFDGIEVFNGYDLARLERVEEVLADYYALLDADRRLVATGSSDAHRIQYQWAGYPRTMVRVDGVGDVATQVLGALKRGHATVTSGPLVSVDVRAAGARTSGTGPGDELDGRGQRLVAHVTVDAAPWVDVTEVSLVAEGKVVERAEVPSRPTRVGREPGTREEAESRARRFEGELPVPGAARWIMVLVRGARRMDDVLAFMPALPFAFTNPVFIRR